MNTPEMNVFHKESDKELAVVGFAYAARDGVEAVVVDEEGNFNSISLRSISVFNKKDREANLKKATEKSMAAQNAQLASQGQGGMTEAKRKELIDKGEVSLSAEEQAVVDSQKQLEAGVPADEVPDPTTGISAKEKAAAEAEVETSSGEERMSESASKSKKK